MTATPDPSMQHAVDPHDLRLNHASAKWDGETLLLDTGLAIRRWRWTPTGFATIGLQRTAGRELVVAPPDEADWRLPGGLDMRGATLLSIAMAVDNDEGFTPEHLAIDIHIRYPRAGCVLHLCYWVFPDAPGFRSQGALRLDSETVSHGNVADDIAVTADRLPVACRGAHVRAAGYYSQTQQRNSLATPLLREEQIPDDGSCDWASLCFVENDGEGCALVKESHKCVNQTGYDGGTFLLGADGLRSTGWGLRRSDLRHDRERRGWAHWTLCYAADDADAAARAVRAFLRRRYPHDPVRDEYVLSNTWGSCTRARDSRDAAREDNVLRELEVAGEIGVDAVQIDDGWQVALNSSTWRPEDRWLPHPHPYPQGWHRIRERASELGVGLGLWAAGEPISLEDLQANAESGGFRHFKLDFMDLDSYERIEALHDKVRAFVAGTGHRVRVNWDATEIEPRIGYFWLRDCGCLYLANRKPAEPESTRYRPHTVLRDAWELARYQRLQDIQLTMQNPDKTFREGSDAWQHPADYCLAITLMGTPVLFQELQYLLPEARRQIRELLDIYRPHRAAIYRGDVRSIGDKPCNAAHTGFHCRVDERQGYFLCFREIGVAQPTGHYMLPELAGAGITLQDLKSKNATTVDIGSDGDLSIEVDSAPGFRFLHYRIR